MKNPLELLRDLVRGRVFLPKCLFITSSIDCFTNGNH
jgi:hypothetical protein